MPKSTPGVMPPMERSEETSRAAALLAASREGQVVTWEALSEAVGMNARPTMPGYHHVRSARNVVLAEQGITFAPVNTVGLVHLTPEGKLEFADSRRRRARRQATRGLREVNTTDVDRLGPHDQARLHATRSLLLAVANQGSKRKLDQAVRRATSAELPPPPVM